MEFICKECTKEFELDYNIYDTTCPFCGTDDIKETTKF